MNIAQVLEYKLKFDDLVAEMKEAAKGTEAIFLPACFGLENQEFMESLRKATGLPLFELPTLPPSLLGMRQRIQLRHRFEKLGGLMMNGDSALKAHFHGEQSSCNSNAFARRGRNHGRVFRIIFRQLLQ